MAIKLHGSLWSLKAAKTAKATVLLGHSTLNEHYHLIPAQGAWKDLSKKFPYLPIRVGALLKNLGIRQDLEDPNGKTCYVTNDYKLFFTGIPLPFLNSPNYLVLFQTRRKYFDSADPELIKESLERLKSWVTLGGSLFTVNMEYSEELNDLTLEIPDQVFLWKSTTN